MRYSVYVVRGLLLKVLRLVGAKSYSLGLYILKHPIKSIWFLIRAYILLLLAGFFLSFIAFKAFAQQSIYESASGSVPAKTSQSCTTGQTSSQWLASLNVDRPRVSGDTTYERYSISKNNTEFFPPSSVCEVQLEARAYYSRNNGDGIYDDGYQQSSKNLRGFVEEVPTCTNLGNNPDGTFTYPDHTLLHLMQDGSAQCFTAQSLEDVDSCEINTPHLLATADSPSMTCFTKPDDSKCAMEKYEVNGQYAYQQALEPSACYEGEIATNPYENPTTEPLTGTECQPLGNGIRACPSDPSEVCNASTGQCNTGCGTYDIGNGPVFICLQDEQASCDPTITASCSAVTTPEEPIDEPIDEPYEPPIDTEDPDFQTSTGTNTLLTGTNQILTSVGSGVQGVKRELEDIKEELETTKTVNFNDDLYTPNDYETRNYGTVLESAVNEMKNTELAQSVNTFFEVQMTGSCPIYSGTIPYLNTTITIDQFCGPVMNSVWPIVSAIVLLVFSVLAFKVAIL